jgi:2-dehydro-3-deoxy-D-gluconate 5-dehydrogenase
MSQFELNDKVAIVTGGGGTSHGIGSCIAQTLASAGAKVAVVGRTQAPLDQVVSLIKAQGGEAISIVADVTNPAAVESMVEQVKSALGHIDILVNSAGGSSFGNPEDIAPEDWTDCLALNLNGTFFCSAAVAKEMIAQQSGKIINIGSSSGIKGEEHAAHYAAAKAAVINLTRSLAISWAVHNINVNCISPGSVEVPDHDIPDMPDEEYAKQQKLQSVEGGKPLTLPGKPQDIANSVLFFASAGSDGMTGENLVVRGSEWASAYA